jgi:hypothetical protein
MEGIKSFLGLLLSIIGSCFIVGLGVKIIMKSLPITGNESFNAIFAMTVGGAIVSSGVHSMINIFERRRRQQ